MGEKECFHNLLSAGGEGSRLEACDTVRRGGRYENTERPRAPRIAFAAARVLMSAAVVEAGCVGLAFERTHQGHLRLGT